MSVLACVMLPIFVLGGGADENPETSFCGTKRTISQIRRSKTRTSRSTNGRWKTMRRSTIHVKTAKKKQTESWKNFFFRTALIFKNDTSRFDIFSSSPTSEWMLLIELSVLLVASIISYASPVPLSSSSSIFFVSRADASLPRFARRGGVEFVLFLFGVAAAAVSFPLLSNSLLWSLFSVSVHCWRIWLLYSSSCVWDYIKKITI